MIFGQQVRLRAPERSDIQRFTAWLNDPEVRAGLLLYLPISTVEEEGWFEGMINCPAYEHTLVIEICPHGDWIPIGSCGFHKVDLRVRCGEVGIFIGEKAYWNQGYGTAVMTLLLRHGFETLNLNRVFLTVYASNPRAIRSYEKAGFVHEGRMRQGMYQDGQYIDILFMSVLRSEWEERETPA